MLSSIASFVAEIQTQKSHRDEREQGGPTVEPTSKKLKVSDANTNILSSELLSPFASCHIAENEAQENQRGQNEPGEATVSSYHADMLLSLRSERNTRTIQNYLKGKKQQAAVRNSIHNYFLGTNRKEVEDAFIALFPQPPNLNFESDRMVKEVLKKSW